MTIEQKPSFNDHEIKDWNGQRAMLWVKYADRLDTMFSTIADTLMRTANISGGDKVLDLGCGNGSTTLLAASQVGPNGSVTGVDVSEPMIGLAQARCANAGITNVNYILGDAAEYPFDSGSFNVLISRFGSMFFGNPEVAFQNIIPALTFGARVVLIVWRSPQENLWATKPVEAAKEFIEMPLPPGPEDPGPFSFADTERVKKILEVAGFCGIDFTPLDLLLPLGNTLEDAVNYVMEMGPLSAPLAAVKGDKREMAITAITCTLRDNQGEDGIVRLAGACWIVTCGVS